MKSHPLDPFIRELSRATRRLAADQGPIGRRNARRAVHGKMQSIGNAMDKLFPAESTPVLQIFSKYKSQARLAAMNPRDRAIAMLESTNLFTKRKWSRERAALFVRIAVARGYPRVHLRYRTTVSNPADFHFSPRIVVGSIYEIPPQWSDRRRWQNLIYRLSAPIFAIKTRELLDLFRQFWKEPIPVTDLLLASEHQAFLDSLAPKRKKAAAAGPSATAPP
jgi:hypothetical protein